MKKLTALIAAFFTILTLSANGVEINGICYLLTNAGAKVTYTGADTHAPGTYSGTITIPASVLYEGNTYPVTGISQYAFLNCKELMAVSIPATVRSIDVGAFMGCLALEAVSLPPTITSIPEKCFRSCRSLESIKIPNTVRSIGDWAFDGCPKLASVTMSSALTSIGQQAFTGCVSLHEISLPKTMLSVGNWAFRDSRDMTIYADPSVVQKLKAMSTLADCTITSKTFVAAPDEQVEIPNIPVPAIVNATPKASATPTTPTTISAVDKEIPTTNLKNEKTFVVIVANENYKQVCKVPYALNDGNIFAQYCEKTLGIPASNIRKHLDATYMDMEMALSDINDIAKAYNGDINIIFYYAGHGIPDEATKDAFLLPVDVNGSQTRFCLPVSKLYSELADTHAKHVAVLMDACFSGSQRGDGMIASARGVALEAKPSTPQGNMVVLSAAQGNETAYPYKEMGHGLFTYYVLKKLQDSKGNVNLQDLGDYVKQNVSQKSVVENHKSQTPCLTPSNGVPEDWQSWKLY